MDKNISREPLQNEIGTPLGGSKAWKIVGSDASGNVLLIESLSWEIRWDYAGRTDGQAVYVGYAKPGTSILAATWLMHKFTFVISGDFSIPSRRQVVEGIWDDRTMSFT